jgi:hypothetical protein
MRNGSLSFPPGVFGKVRLKLRAVEPKSLAGVAAIQCRTMGSELFEGTDALRALH